MSSTTKMPGDKPSLRVTAPPGGHSSDIFSPATEANASPRRIKDYQKSRIFEGDTNSNDVTKRSSSPMHKDTQSRLFGAGEANHSPRKVNDTFKSTVFAKEQTNSTEVTTPKKKLERNPITGSEQNGVQNGVHENGINGHCEQLELASEANGFSHENED